MTHEENITQLREKNVQSAYRLVQVALRYKALGTAIEILSKLDNSSNTVKQLANTKREYGRETEILEQDIQGKENYIESLKELIAQA